MVLFLKLKQGQGGMNQRISQNSCSEASSDMRKRNNHKFSVWFLVWMVVSNIFYFYPYLEKIPILTNIFQMGWNRQPVVIYPFFVLMVWILEVCFAYIHQGGEMWVFSVFKIYSWSQTKLGFDLRCASQGSKWIIWVTQYLSGRDWAKTNKINSLSKFQGLLYVFSLDSLSWWFCFFRILQWYNQHIFQHHLGNILGTVSNHLKHI